MLDLFVILNPRKSTSNLKKPMFMRSKSTEALFKRKSILDILCLKKKSMLIKFLKISKALMSLVLPKDTESLESSRDSESESYQEKHIEVLEESVVSELGIHPKSNGQSPELVTMVSIIELNKIKEFTKWARLSQITTPVLSMT